ncbi:hypothetical protein JKP88DRAFT_181232, partial [Tribonema minus]
MLDDLLKSAHQIHANNRRVVDLETTFNVLSIAAFNAHAFHTSASTAAELAAPSSSLKPTGSAQLFHMESQAAHSCDPNCIQTTQAPLGYLTFRAIRPIKAGELVTIAYVDATKSTEERRKELARTQDYLCVCPQCTSPDPTGGLRCPGTGCTG